MTVFPPFIENFFTSRAKGALLSARFLVSLAPTRFDNAPEIHTAHILFGLTFESGSLSKNILKTHGVTSEKILKILNLPSYYSRKIKAFERSQIPNGSKLGTSKFGQETKVLIKKALGLAMKHNQPYVGTEHLLYALASSIVNDKKAGAGSAKNQPADLKFTKLQFRILTWRKANEIKKHLESIFSQNMPISNFPRLTKNVKSETPFGTINENANTDHEEKILPRTKGRIKDKSNYLSKMDEELHDFHAHDHEHLHNKKHASGIKESRRKKRALSAMDVFCENLTLAAEKNKLDPVIGRENEIARLINILSRRTKNNPLLIGEPGVGKTAIVQGLAQKITNGEVPENLTSKEVMNLNLNSLIAGAVFRGDFEARIQQVIHEATKNNIILFIDEIHTIIGAGSVPGSLDAANILKPALSSGKIQCIGATTLEEYKKYIEKERALERRFQPILIKEESEEQSISTLSNLKKIYEDHHGVIIDAEAIKSAVELSSRYIRGRFLPDKAIDVLDEAASRLRTIAFKNSETKSFRSLEKMRQNLTSKKEEAISRENYKDALTLRYEEEMILKDIDAIKRRNKKFFLKPVLTRAHIEGVIESMTGIPVRRNDNEYAALKDLQGRLKKEIIGQDRAISELINTVKRNKAGLNDPKRPVGSFIFVGPSGVGKTALARAIAATQSQNLVKLDMSEYAEPYSISRLVGAPPGYIGYEEGGELTEKVKRNPYSVILLDEIEKAHPQIHNILISILDEGTAKDAKGDEISFKNTVVILTSNANLDDEFDTKKPIGFSVNSREALNTTKERYNEYMKRILKREIINRVDKVIMFRHLAKSDIEKIAESMLAKLKENLLKNKLEVNFAENVASFIAQKSYKPREGARLVRATLEKYVENPVAEYVISNRNAKKITVSLNGGKINVK